MEKGDGIPGILWRESGMIYSYFEPGRKTMGTAVKKTISLPPDLAQQVEEIAESEGKSVSAVVQDALRLAQREYLKREYKDIQSYWSTKAREKGILTDSDLRRYLND